MDCHRNSHETGGYVSSALNGVLSPVPLFRGSRDWHGAATGAIWNVTSDFAGQAYDVIYDGKDYNNLKALGSIASGAISGHSAWDIELNGLNVGRGSQLATFRSLSSRYVNGSIAQFPWRYGVTGASARLTTGSAGSILGAGLDGTYGSILEHYGKDAGN